MCTTFVLHFSYVFLESLYFIDVQGYGGEGGIRTLEGLQTLAGFQDQCIQPLCHLSRNYLLFIEYL